MYHVDSHFITGSTHLVNQDYALGGSVPAPYVVVSDGCSSSPDTDVGARLIALSARDYLITALSAGVRPEPMELGRYAVMKAQQSARTLEVEQRSLDATLLVAYPADEAIEAVLFGDGAVITTDLAGTIRVLEVEYSHNTPYYPVQQFTPAAAHRYRSYSAQREAVKWVRHWRAGVDAPRVQQGEVFGPTVARFPVRDLRLLAVVTDGISSVRSVDGLTSVSVLDMAEQLAAVRSPEGAFMKRRLRRAAQTLEKQSLVNGDDLAIGAMLFARDAEG